MKVEQQMTKYNNSLWGKIKQKLLYFFYGNRKNNNINKSASTEEKSKEEIISLYNKVKSGNVNLDDLDEKMLYKIALLLKEEIDILNEKLKEDFYETTMHLNNLKMYNKEVQLLRKNS